ncbi:MAG TPA: ABC transporter permease [Actinomycetota bacterium]|nr:ABC transporter permease [Actinomycetota bacterium]
MWAMAMKEFRQLRRDRRTLAMMILMPVLLLVVFGYAASFDVDRVRTVVVGPRAEQVAAALPERLEVVRVAPGEGRKAAVEALRDAEAAVALVAGDAGRPDVLVDGADLFSARAVVTELRGRPGLPAPEVLFNPGLETSAIMVPGLMGVVLVFVGTIATALGVVRERQSGTLEQLAVMPFRPRDVLGGKLLPYLGVAVVDLAVIVAVGVLFDVPFAGSPLVFALGALLFLFVTVGIGVLISTVSETQGQAIQLAIMTMLPQILLSGLIFPLQAMAPGVRWIGYLLPLTWFIQLARGVMVRGAPFEALLLPLTMLAVQGAVVFSASIARFRRDLAPSGRGHGADEAEAVQDEAAPTRAGTR